MITIIKYMHIEHEIDEKMFDKNLNTMLSNINKCVRYSVVDKIKEKCLDPIESSIRMMTLAVNAREETINKDNIGVW